ncbi:MAG: hypothetical protein ACK5PP_02040 [Acidimicrobiales bacterium]
MGRLPGRRLDLPPFALVAALQRTLGEPKLVAAVTLGPLRRNRKPVLQLIRPDGITVGFAKVGWSPMTAALVDAEAAALRRMAGRLPADHTIPAVIHHGPWRDGSVVVLTSVTGGDGGPGSLLAALRRRRGGTGDDTTTPPLAATIAAIASVDAEPGRAVADLAVFQEWRRLEATAPLYPGLALDAVISVHGRTRLDVGWWHGDLTPWNRWRGGGSVVVWDWELAGPGRPVGADALHHHFELHRRTDGDHRSALDAVVDAAPDLLAGVGVDPEPAVVAATIDLYLCDLLARERRLEGQRWDGGAMAGLADVAGPLLRRRLAAPTPPGADPAGTGRR